MNYSIVGLLVIFVSSTGITQEINIEVRNTFSHSITTENLKAVSSISDLYVGYPSSWISEYESIEINTTTGNITEAAISTNDILTQDQVRLLNSSEIGTEISINVKYRERNAITHKMDISTLKYNLTVMPEIEAEYIGGTESLTQYLKENAIDKIQELPNRQFAQAIIKFTIDSDGDVSNIEMTPTVDTDIDQLLTDVLNNMPLWKAAADSTGKKVKQEFVLRIGNNIGC